jgi:EmrB/QacA subfamily drug resistance transporter
MSTQRIASNRFAPLAVLMAGTFMVVLDFFIVNVALPSMQRQLHASASSTEWVVAGYGVALAAFLITAGRLGDAFGRRRIFVVGLALFTLASGACGAASDATVLVVARVAQGLAAGLLSPSVLSIISVVYRGEDRARALGVYGLVMGLAAVGGQLVGGVLIHLDIAGLGWRSCFLLNLPIGATALVLTPKLIGESRAPVRDSLDPLGTFLLTDAVLALALPLVEGRQHGWPLWTWCSLAAAPALLGALIVQQRARLARGQAALIAPALLRERAFSTGLGLQIFFWAGQASFFLVLALYLQEGRQMSALGAGAVFTILAAAYLATSIAAPGLTARYGRRVIAVGAGTLAAGHLALLFCVSSIGVGGSVVALAPGLLLAGAGMGLCVTPLTTISLTSIAPESAGAGSGALSTVQQVGNALGVAITGAIYFGAQAAGVAHAFELSLGELAALLLGVAAMSRMLPGAPAHGRRAGEAALADA